MKLKNEKSQKYWKQTRSCRVSSEVREKESMVGII